MDNLLNDLEMMRSSVARAVRNLRDAAIDADKLGNTYNHNSDLYAQTAHTLWGMEVASRKLEQELAELYSSIRVNSVDERAA